MSKGKKPKEERVHLNMSFEDALRAAANTKPPMDIELKLNKPIEIPNVSGRKVTLSTIQIPKMAVSQFIISIQVTNTVGASMFDKIAFNPDEFEFDQSLRKIPEKDNTNPIAVPSQLFITLTGSQNIDHCTITYFVE